MAKRPGHDFDSRLDWYYISRRNLYRVVLGFLAVAAIVVFAVWFWSTRGSATLGRAREEIARAEELLGDARRLKEADRFTEEIGQGAARVEEAQKTLSAGDPERARSQAVTAQQLLRSILSGKLGDKGDANVIEVAGRVELQRANTTKWDTLRPGVVLREGDFVKTGASGVAEVMATDGTLYRIKPETLFEVHRSVTVPGEGKASGAKIVVGGSDVTTGEGGRSILTTSVARTDISKNSAVGVESDATTTNVATFKGKATLSTGNGPSVVLGERERAAASKAGGIGEKQHLPDTPAPLEPEDNAMFELGRSEVVLRWSAVKDATQYQFEIARSRLFVPDSISIKQSRPRTETKIRVDEPGLYFWRVQSVKLEPRPLESGWTAPRRFKVVGESEKAEKTGVPPDLVVYRPQVIGTTVIVSGKTEPGAKVTVNGEEADVDATGVFRKVINLPGGGVKPITIRAVGSSGLETLRKESVLVQD
jgi:hypothetical protein